MSIKNRIRTLKAKAPETVKNAIDFQGHSDRLLIADLMEFDYGDTYPEIRTEYLDMYLNTDGQAWIDKETFVVYMATPAGEPDEYGVGKDLIITTMNGETEVIDDFRNSDKGVYFTNYMLPMPDLSLDICSDLLTEIDESLRHNIANSRLTPHVFVKDEGIKQAIIDAEKSTECGVMKIILGKDSEWDEAKPIEVLNINDVKDQNMIQYLTHAYDDITRRFYNEHGYNVQGSTAKMAQQSVEEISGGQGLRMISPLAKLLQRRKNFEELDKLTGRTSNVQFSEQLKREFAIPEDKKEEQKGDPENENEISSESIDRQDALGNDVDE